MRAIYYFHSQNIPLFLITVYAKAEREDITPDQKRMMRDFVTDIKQDYKLKGMQP